MNSKKAIIIILLLALLVRGIFFVALWHNGGLSYDRIVFKGDSEEYNSLARGLIKGYGFSHDGKIKDSRRTPLYPLFVACIYFLFGIKPWLVLLFQAVIGVIAVWLVYALAMAVFDNNKVAFIAGFLYSIDPASIVFSLRLSSDFLFATTFTIALLTLFLALRVSREREKERKRERERERCAILFIFGGLCLGLATLVRPISLYFGAIVIFIILLWVSKNKYYRLADMVKMAIIFLTVFELTLLPWQLRNFINFKSFDITSMQGWNLFYYNAVVTEANRSKISEDEARARLEKLMPLQAGTLNELKKSKVYQKVALNHIKAHPKDYLLTHLKGSLNVFTHSTKYEIMEIFALEKRTYVEEDFRFQEKTIDRLKRIITNARDDHYLSFLLMALALLEYILFFIGLCHLLIKKYWKLVISFVAIISYIGLISGVVGEARFKLPVIPIYLVLSSYGIIVLGQFLDKKIKSFIKR